MKPERLLMTAILPALAELELLGIKDTPEARRFLLAIALQESGLRHRQQVTASGKEAGPAASFWQFERAGGCRGVLSHKMTANLATRMCEDFNIERTEQTLWEAMKYNDVVAAMAARLLVYTLPWGLPKTAADGWRQYLFAWRPGKPHEATWAGCWKQADNLTMPKAKIKAEV